MSTPSILSALKKMRALLNREEKLKWLAIGGFAVCTSVLEIITATVIIIFAQILNDPDVGVTYFAKYGVPGLTTGRAIVYTALIVGVVYLIKNIIAAMEIFFQNFSVQKMSYNFKVRMLSLYSNMDYSVYLTRNAAQGAQIIGGDSDLVYTSGMISIASILSEGIVFICLVAMIVYINPMLAVTIFVLGGLISLFLIKYLLPKFYGYGQKLQEADLQAWGNLVQFFHGFKEIVLLGKRREFIDTVASNFKIKAAVRAVQTAITTAPRLVIEVLFIGIFITAIAIMCFNHEAPRDMMGIMGGYLYTGFRLMPGLNRIISQLNLFKSTIPSIDRVYQEYNQPFLKDTYVDMPDLTFTKSIDLTGVSFKYKNTKRLALSDVSLSINKGECIGVVGETGSGKSTLIDMILGLLKPENGSVLIDGQYAANSPQWHQRIGYVPQSLNMIDATIAKNIAFGDTDVDLARLNKAVDDAQLRKFIDQLPDGLETMVGERGIRLSGGERQRISIARALYRSPEVLIFDEATSALDNETEAKVMETIRSVSHDRTVIMIAHRLTTLKDCDRIIKMDMGKIVETKDNKRTKHA